MITRVEDKLIALIKQGIKIRALLEGPPGCGKGHMALTIAEHFGAPLYKMSSHQEMTSLSIIYDLVVINNQITYQWSPLVRAFEESSRGRVVLLLDEIDKTKKDVEALLLHILEDYSIPGLPGIEEVIRGNPDNLIIVATSNGRREFSEEFQRRWTPRLKLEYPDRDTQRKILTEWGIPTKWETIINALRGIDAFKAPSYPEVAWCHQSISAGFPVEMILRTLWKGDDFPLPWGIQYIKSIYK